MKNERVPNLLDRHQCFQATARVRRAFLKCGVRAAAAWLTVGLLQPLRAFAAEWSKPAFEARKIDEALQNIFGATQAIPSDLIKISAPNVAENGAMVRFAVSTNLPDVTTIAVLVEKNQTPLVTVVKFSGARPFLSLRMKMAETSDVYVLAQSEGKVYSAKQNIKITIGGCGG